MKTPEISVIVPVYNVMPYINRCLDSVCNQTFDALEIILVDDGSTDGSGKVCDEYAENDERIRVVHQEKQGLSAARNAGLELCTCDLVGFVDSDDWIEPDMYQMLYDNLCKFNADVSTCASDRVKFDEGISVEPCLRSREDAMLAVMQNPYVSVFAWNKLYRKRLFDEVRYPIGKLYEDYYVILDLLEKADLMVSTNAPKYHYTKREDSITNLTYNLREEDRVAAAQKNLEFVKAKHPELISAAESRLLLAHFLCLEKILRAESGSYSDAKKEHCRALRKKLFFIMFSCTEPLASYRTLSFFIKVIFPDIYCLLSKVLTNKDNLSKTYNHE